MAEAPKNESPQELDSGAVDYRKMLVIYLRHVGEAEGVDYLGDGPSCALPGMTEAEGVEMAKIRDADRRPKYRFYKD